ncbi:MAG: hypothetical protein K8S98_18390 [Planctomycetes bacterium]|jgi:hypothetical protein|nr:hypothetical protein [Planctomycetota bacterium]
MNPHGHAFWWLVAAFCIVWYSTVTIYVAIRGARDIRVMLERLAKSERPD